MNIFLNAYIYWQRKPLGSLDTLEVLPKVLGKVPPDAVDVGAAIAGVIVFHQEGGTL